MTTSATRGNWAFSYGTAGASPVYSALPEATSVSGIGQTNPLIDVTSFDSTSKEYIAGLADGTEVQLECNYIADNATLLQLMTDVEAGTTGNFKAVYSGVSPQKTFTFSAVALSYEIGPAFDDKNTVKFSLKISGSITRA